MTALSAFGVQIRQHRKQRGMSQLDLAYAAGSTSRYISFIETGRSRPGKDIILRISDALNLTPRDSNELLISAGLPIIFSEALLEDEEMTSVRKIIDRVFKKHEPFPAWAIGPGLRFLDSNQAAEKVFPGLVGMPPQTLIDLWCAPSTEVTDEERAYRIYQTLSGLRKEVYYYPHPDIPALINQIEAYAAEIDRPPDMSDDRIMCPTLSVNGQQVRTLSTVMRFDKVVNVTMSEIRIELIFPADDESETILRAL
ncbi:helix-turn-helix domain-containing protein [Marinicella sp. W31]|uniref:helix-turn-helix domain-containing protein n=1 Tax=Marinicella sp. W31 TaxID=3023713 RepID=UPI003756F991